MLSQIYDAIPNPNDISGGTTLFLAVVAYVALFFAIGPRAAP